MSSVFQLCQMFLPVLRWRSRCSTRTSQRWWTHGPHRKVSHWSPWAATAIRWRSRRSTSCSRLTMLRAPPGQLVYHTQISDRATTLTVPCTLFSLWHIPVTYVKDSCSSGPECTQLFTLKTKSGKDPTTLGQMGRRCIRWWNRLCVGVTFQQHSSYQRV